MIAQKAKNLSIVVHIIVLQYLAIYSGSRHCRSFTANHSLCKSFTTDHSLLQITHYGSLTNADHSLTDIAMLHLHLIALVTDVVPQLFGDRH
jgi:hypothetical protein